ncbi:MAG: UvrD-helicase domain-containing protein [Acidimicrobiales bacterium]
MTTAGPVPFDVCGPLPAGVTVLEASAGTGKTFTIAALTARYVAAGTPLDKLLLVTFTRMATGELRERVRSRLVDVERGLALARAGVPPPGDSVVQLLATGSADELAMRHGRMVAALADFDAATIETTHGFCQQILFGLGVAGDVERDVIFSEDLGELIEEVVDDLYVRRFYAGGSPPFGRSEALRIAKAAIDHLSSPIEPGSAPADTDWAMRVRFATRVRSDVELRKRRAKVITYDDLLTRLEGTLRDESGRGAAARRRLRERFAVVLVDEFQDTDPTQWEIMRRAFGEAPSTLVLIGDPKQAIYAFRGADVYAYLDAAGTATERSTLSTNWRSDQGLIDAYDACFRGARLGHPGIRYTRVRAADANQASRLVGAPRAEALRVRVVHRDDGLARLTGPGNALVGPARQLVAEDVAADLVRLLSSGAGLVTRHDDGTDTGCQPLQPGHVAVLVRTHRQAAVVRDALEAVRIPAVINGAGSVLDTPIARQWLVLLEALERPASPSRARAAALTSFIGWTPERLAATDEPGWEGVHARLHGWAALLRRQGVASLLETITHGQSVPGRLLARDEGDRLLTDLRHVGQLLHAEAVAEGLGVTALASWLRARIAEAGEDTTSEERSRRLESDAEAVQILTIHRSKGLEFPVVYLPYLWDQGRIPDPAKAGSLVFHDPSAGNRRTLHVGMGGGPGFTEAWRQNMDEDRGEDLRLAYVALTRAQHQAVVWWAGSWDSRNSPLGRLLFSRDDEGNVAVEAGSVPEDAAVVATFERIAADLPGCVSVERVTGSDGATLGGRRAEVTDLDVSRFGRSLDTRWRRTSYSAITSGAHEPGVASEPETAGLTDEAPAPGAAAGGALGGGPAADLGDGGAAAGGAGAEAPDDEERRLRAVPLPLAAMPGGTEIGTLVHSVLEGVDFASADLDAELATGVEQQRRWHNVDLGDPPVLVAGLRAAIETPLGPIVGNLCLRDLGRADRRDEMVFELPLTGGDTPTGTLTLPAIVSLLRAHLPTGDMLAGYPDRLADPSLQQDLRGYLTGSLDLVLRVRAPDDTPRFAVVDYKTNRLGGDDDRALTAWHYRPTAMAEAMQAAHYPLQALLYTVALHRYLRWRQPGYDPERNLAGVLYLFLRGMSGPSVPLVGGQPCGVFAWQPPPGLVVALSDLFDRGAEAVA